MSCVDTKQNRGRLYDYVFFAVLLVIYTAVTFWLFSKQVYGTEEFYHSDVKAYILEMQGLDSGYSFPYQLFFKLAAFLHLFIKAPEMAVATALTILNSLSLVVMRYYADKVLISAENMGEQRQRLWIPFLVTTVVFALFFVSMLYGVGFQFPGIRGRYRGVFSPNPYHNATYMATRPFAIATFFVFIKVLKEYEEKFKWKDVVVFGIVLFLTTITKPSFTFILVPAAGLIMLYRMFRSKFKNIKNTILLGIGFLPTFAALLYQFFGVFGPVEGQETGIGFGLGVAWSYHSGNILLAMVLGLAFPIAVLCLNFRELKRDKVFCLAWQVMAVSAFEILFLYEKGFRIGDLNFSWGYMHGMFFVFTASVFLLFRKTFLLREAGGEVLQNNTKKVVWSRLLLLGQWGVFALHLLLGLLYFKSILAGGLYY